MIKVKICGITNLPDAIMAAQLGADALGFIFAPSPRQVDPVEAKRIIEKLPPWITTVGVFVNEKMERVTQIANICGIDCVQLHGEETPEYCAELDIKAIKTVRKNITIIPDYNVSGILLDVSDGKGKRYDLDIAIKAKEYGKPIILAGGLTPENVKEAIRNVKPYGVDVSSGVESGPGKKDYKKLKLFLKNTKGK